MTLLQIGGRAYFFATPTRISRDDDGYDDHVERMIEVLRRSPVLRLGGGRTVTLSSVRRPARTISLSAEAKIDREEDQIAAIVFGPENGAVSQNLVFEAAKEANVKGYRHLYVFGFAIQPDARSLIEISDHALGIPATYVQVSHDLTMGDLLKNMRSSQIFSVCGLPEVRIERADEDAYRVHLSGLDVFDPATMETDHRDGADVPAWFLDTDYNGLCFHVCQAFFHVRPLGRDSSNRFAATSRPASGNISPERAARRLSRARMSRSP